MELIEDGVQGFIVPAGDVDLIARAIAWLTTHPSEAAQMGVQAQRKAAANGADFAADNLISGALAALGGISLTSENSALTPSWRQLSSGDRGRKNAYLSPFVGRRSALRTTASTRPARLDSSLVVFLYLTIAFFYAANVYHSSMSSILGYAKWVPLILLFPVVLYTAKRHNIRPANRGLSTRVALLLAAATVSTLAGPYADTGVFVLISLFLSLVTALSLGAIVFQRNAQARFFDVIADVGRGVITVSVVMAVFGINLGRGTGRFSGWTDNPNTLALMLAPTIVILAARVMEKQRGWAYLHAPFIAAGLYVLVLTGSRSSIGWIVISMMAIWLARTGIGFLSLAVVVGGLVLLAVGDAVFEYMLHFMARSGTGEFGALDTSLWSGRSEVWEIGLGLFEKNPLIGIGIGASQPVLSSLSYLFEQHQGAHFHSSYLTSMVETGIIGASIFFLIIIIAVVNGFRVARIYHSTPIRFLADTRSSLGAAGRGAGPRNRRDLDPVGWKTPMRCFSGC